MPVDVVGKMRKSFALLSTLGEVVFPEDRSFCLEGPLLEEVRRAATAMVDSGETTASLDVPDVANALVVELRLLPPDTPIVLAHVVNARDRAPGVLAVWSSFSPAERDVAGAVCKGFQNAEVAELLEVSVNTVHSHVKKIFKKAGVSNRAELAGFFGGGVPTAPSDRAHARRVGRQRRLDQLLAPLTDRQRAVARLLRQGLGPAAIAERLALTSATVRSHLGSISQRLGVRGCGALRALLDPAGASP